MSIIDSINSNNKLSFVGDKQRHSVLFLGSNSNTSSIHEQFALEGYDIHNQPDLANLESSISEHSPSLLVFDIGCTSAQKLAELSVIRSFYEGALMVIATSSCEQDQVLAFNLGTDEFLVKPVSSAIVLCRAKALLRRCEAVYLTSPDKLSIGDIALFPQSQKCEVKNSDVHLTFFEFKLLMLLAENAGKVMSREHIYTSLLRRTYNGIERTVDVRMSQLRDKLSNKGVKNGAIETVWGQGYMFNLAA